MTSEATSVNVKEVTLSDAVRELYHAVHELHVRCGVHFDHTVDSKLRKVADILMALERKPPPAQASDHIPDAGKMVQQSQAGEGVVCGRSFELGAAAEREKLRGIAEKVAEQVASEIWTPDYRRPMVSFSKAAFIGFLKCQYAARLLESTP